MSTLLMALGRHLFRSVYPQMDNTPMDSFSREVQATWPSQQRLSRAPAMQFTGPGNDTITIEARILPHVFGGVNTIKEIEKSTKNGEVMRLFRFSASDILPFSAHYLGNYVVTNMRVNETRIASDGNPTAIDFALELVRYGDDDYAIDRAVEQAAVEARNTVNEDGSFRERVETIEEFRLRTLRERQGQSTPPAD